MKANLTNDGHYDNQFVIIGGSYPGAMSAWFKEKFDNLVVASWSSSGVIHAIEDYRNYDWTVYDATLNNSWECLGAIQNATYEIESRLYNFNSSIRNETLEFFGTNNTNMSNQEFLFFIADIFASGVQGGQRT